MTIAQTVPTALTATTPSALVAQPTPTPITSITNQTYWSGTITTFVGLITGFVALLHPGFRESTTVQYLVTVITIVASSALAGWMNHVSHKTAQTIITATSVLYSIPSAPTSSGA